MGDSYVCSKAKIKCSCGDKISTLTVFPDRTIWLTGEPQANISDHIPMRNIAPFGKCRSLAYPATASATAAAHGKLTPMPCVPGTKFPWMGGKNDVLLKGQPALLKSSRCKCIFGGTITITFDGQTDGERPDLNIERKSSNEELNGIDISEEKKLSVLDGIQLALDVAGFVPGFGAAPDLLNAAIHACRGNWVDAGLSLLAAVPVIGDAAAAAKIAHKGFKATKYSKYAKKTISKDIDVSIKGLVKQGYSVDDAKIIRRAVRNERRDFARNFYRQQNPGMPESVIESHVRGIDIKKPLSVETVPPPDIMYQYRIVKNGKLAMGKYFTPDKTAIPSQLGIGEFFVFRKKGKMIKKLHTEVSMTKPKLALKSTAYGMYDTWSVPGKAFKTQGGAIQYYIP